jgi:hypothetical protein
MNRRNRRTRRKAQHGGGFSTEDNERIGAFFKAAPSPTKDQIVHCVSQLRRFAACFKIGDTSRLMQFSYNLGRLQELCGETTHPEIWWSPVEKLLNTNKWDELYEHVDTILTALGTKYDDKTLAKGC